MRGRSVGALLLAALTLAGCSGGGGGGSSPSPTPAATTTSPTPDPVSVARRAVVASYTGLYADVAVATAAGSATDPVLGRNATGAARDELAVTVRAYLQQGVTLRGTPTTHPTVSALDLTAGSATVTDCPSYATVTAIDRRTGHPVVGFFKGSANPVTVTFRLHGTSWLATFIKTDRSRTCAG